MFDPNLKIGQVLTNNEIVNIFKCGIQGGMRRSNATNTLVIVSDYTKGIYHDKLVAYFIIQAWEKQEIRI